MCFYRLFRITLYRAASAVSPGSNAERSVQGKDKYFAVPDFTGICRLLDRLGHLFRPAGFDNHLDLYFWNELDTIFSTR